jgi:hypothetical protein
MQKRLSFFSCPGKAKLTAEFFNCLNFYGEPGKADTTVQERKSAFKGMRMEKMRVFMPQLPNK